MKCYNTIKVATSAERAWHVIADKFGEASDWAATIETSTLVGIMGVGAIRSCKTKSVGPFPPNFIEEKVTKYCPQSHSYAYELISGLPSIFKCATNTWSIRSINDKECEITSIVLIEPITWLRPLGWLFPIIIKRDLKQTFEELRFYIEFDKAHPRKQNSIGNV